MAGVAFDDVSKIYADGTRAVNELELEIVDGEFMVLVGPSGCGKTTALRMVAGLEEISEGVIRIGDRVVNHVPSRDRDIAMVFQSYALYPHLSVYDNIAFGLKLKKMPKDGDRDARPGGRAAARPRGVPQAQAARALGRPAAARRDGPRDRAPAAAFLMDEPLSNLDAKLRVQMRAEIARLQSDLGATTIYVTHDQVEAMTMGDRVAVMRKGELQQVAPPQELYDQSAQPLRRRLHRQPGDEHDRGDARALERRARRPWPATSGSRSATRRSPPGPALRAFEGTRRHPRHPPRGPRGRRARAESAERPAPAGKVELREALGSEIMVHFASTPRRRDRETSASCAADVGARTSRRTSEATAR